jgi:hypothetical protein
MSIHAELICIKPRSREPFLFVCTAPEFKPDSTRAIDLSNSGLTRCAFPASSKQNAYAPAVKKISEKMQHAESSTDVVVVFTLDIFSLCPPMQGSFMAILLSS